MSTFLITGANRGLGLEMTRQASAKGHHVIAATRRAADAPELSALAAASGGKVEVVALEVTDTASIAALAAQLAGRPIDVLVNNAGVRIPFRPALETDLADLEKALAINTFAPLRVTQALVPNLALAANGAKVFTISSLLGAFHVMQSEEIPYCVSKTAVNRAMLLLSPALKENNIAVGLLSPGWVRTDMGGSAAPLSPQESVAGLLARIEAFTLADTGTFLSYAGEKQPW